MQCPQAGSHTCAPAECVGLDRQARCCCEKRTVQSSVLPPWQAPAVTRGELRESAAAVAGAALARLLDISRRGGLAPLWGALLGEAQARLARYERAAASTGERLH